VVAEIPAHRLANDAPVYIREARPPAGNGAKEAAGASAPPAREALARLLGDPTIASKNWVFRQYDHQVRTGTVVLPGSDAAVFRVVCGEKEKFLAATVDCNGTFCALDPREGAKMAVAEAARNLACSGARPLAVTDNLNFGNPYKPENFWQLRECVEGLAEACRFFGTPVTGGNVSLYNESPDGAVDPTPVVGMVGLIERKEWITTQPFKRAGDLVYLVGGFGEGLGGSHYAKALLGAKRGPIPAFNFEREKLLQDAVLKAIQSGWVRSAHDLSEGGLAVALAEACISGEPMLGLEADLSPAKGGAEEILYNEAPSRTILSIVPEHQAAWEALEVEKTLLGTVGGTELKLRLKSETFIWKIAELREIWWNTIAKRMDPEEGFAP
jgi:phosphoribosylformylglycinamidine synthase